MTPQEDKENIQEVEVANTFEEDMFGPSRSEPASAPRPKLSMISARLRANEERKRVIEISSQKLECIDDPVRDLRRSVCINNTYGRLTDDARREKEARRKRAREECGIICEETPWTNKKSRRAVEDECLALLDAIPELSDSTLGCSAMARRPTSSSLAPSAGAPTALVTVLDT